MCKRKKYRKFLEVVECNGNMLKHKRKKKERKNKRKINAKG